MIDCATASSSVFTVVADKFKQDPVSVTNFLVLLKSNAAHVVCKYQILIPTSDCLPVAEAWQGARESSR